MREKSIYDYYVFGYNYSFLRNSFTGKKNSEAIVDLQAYLDTIMSLELQVTSHATKPLIGVIQALEGLKGDDVIPVEQATRILEIIEGADKTLDAELQLKKVLTVTPKRFNTEMLLVTPERLLGQSSWDRLSKTARRDFSQASRCIAMNLATAAAFHLMRCVEEMVNVLYLDFVKQKRMDKPMWGPMVERLRNKNQPKPSGELLDHLDIIRANFRNPTQHPEKFYDIDEAQDLLNSSIVVINGICREIERHNDS